MGIVYRPRSMWTAQKSRTAGLKGASKEVVIYECRFVVFVIIFPIWIGETTNKDVDVGFESGGKLFDQGIMALWQE